MPKGHDEGPETLLSAVLDSAADGIIVISPDARVLTYNDRFVQIWNIPRSVLMTRDAHQVLASLSQSLCHPADFVRDVEFMMVDRESRAQGTCRLLDGRIIEKETRPVAVTDKLIGRVWTFRDVTETARAFEMLHESEERFRVFAGSAAYGILMHQDGEVVYANEAAARLLGYPVKELIGAHLSDLVPEEDRPAIRAQAQVRAGTEGAAPSHYEARIRRKDGEIRSVEVGVSSIQLKDKTAVVATLVDLTRAPEGRSRGPSPGLARFPDRPSQPDLLPKQRRRRDRGSEEDEQPLERGPDRPGPVQVRELPGPSPGRSGPPGGRAAPLLTRPSDRPGGAAGGRRVRRPPPGLRHGLEHRLVPADRGQPAGAVPDRGGQRALPERECRHRVVPP